VRKRSDRGDEDTSTTSHILVRVEVTSPSNRRIQDPTRTCPGKVSQEAGCFGAKSKNSRMAGTDDGSIDGC
jgi:hypothetical protein